MEKNISVTATHKDIDWHTLTGDIPFRMTNDYLFRALMQNNNDVLKALIAALLGWKKTDITSAVIENPIVLGEALDSKTFVLDVRVQINNNLTLDLELQVLNAGNWPERSLAYLCRIFVNINKGDDYLEIKPAHHIGILDFGLFPDDPVFNATYQLYNKENMQKYTDKFTLSVVCLPYIDKATDKDKESHLVEWASMFASTKWEELRMLAEKNSDIDKAVTTMYSLNENFNIREQMIRRDEYYAHERYVKRKFAEQAKALDEQAKALEEKDKALKEKDTVLNEQQKALDDQQKTLEEQARIIAELKAQLAAK